MIVALLAAAVLAAVWVVYPLAMALVASVIRPWTREYHAKGAPTVSVVIATRDTAEAARARIADCMRTTYERALVDVVVALDRSGPGISASDLQVPGARITVVTGEEDGKASALNAGVRAAPGEAIVFADTYQRFEPEAIAKLVSALQRPRRGAVSGRLELSSPVGGSAGKRLSAVAMYWSFERWLRKREAEVHSSIGVTGAIYCMWKSLWTPLPAGLILDDVYAPMALVLRGYRVDFVDDARAIETRQPDRTQEYRRKVRTLTGIFQLCAWLPSVLVPVRNPVWVQFVFHKLLRFLTPYCVFVIAVWLAATVLRAGTLRAAAFLATVLALAALLFTGNARPVRHLREVLVQGLQMQAAVIVGTVNGFRGRWDVWRS